MLNRHNNKSAYGRFLKKYPLTIPLYPNKVNKIILVSITEFHGILLVFVSLFVLQLIMSIIIININLTIFIKFSTNDRKF
jgi:hypothetical protein